MSRYVIVKLKHIENKNEGKILKVAREKQHIICLGKTISMTVDFSSKTMGARRKWYMFLCGKKEMNCQPRILYSVKRSFRYKEKIQDILRRRKIKKICHQ